MAYWKGRGSTTFWKISFISCRYVVICSYWISLSFKLKMCCKLWCHIDEAWNFFAVSRYIVISSRFHVSVITNYYLCGCVLEPNLTKVIPFGYLDFAANSMMHIQMLISPDAANLVTIKQLLCHYLFDKLCRTLNDAAAWIHGPSFWDIQRSYHNLGNLAQTVQEVEILVGDCCGA
jgi:hypothetical protein